MPLSPSAAPPARWLRGLAKPEVLRDEGVAPEANACVAWGAWTGAWKIISVFVSGVCCFLFQALVGGAELAIFLLAAADLAH